jgi:hypothetical protein
MLREGQRVDARIGGRRCADQLVDRHLVRARKRRSNSSVGRRWPDSRRDSVLTEIPVLAETSAKVMSCCWRNARSGGPTVPSTLIEQGLHRTSHYFAVPATLLATGSPRGGWLLSEVMDHEQQQ